MTAPTIVGVDPGLSGALALFTGDEIHMAKIPVLGSGKGRAYDLRGIYMQVQGLPTKPRIYIEGFASFGLGTSAVHSLVRCITAFEMAALVLGVQIEVVPSQAWQKVMFAHIEPKDLKPNAKAKIACERLWGAPTAKWNEGQRDAALIAEYGRRTLATAGAEGV